MQAIDQEGHEDDSTLIEIKYSAKTKTWLKLKMNIIWIIEKSYFSK